MADEFPRFDLTGRSALVTGAARGLGAAIAVALCMPGRMRRWGLAGVDAGEIAARIEGMGRRCSCACKWT